MIHPDSSNITSIEDLLPQLRNTVNSTVSFRGIILDMFRQNPTFALGSIRRNDSWECVILDSNSIDEKGITDVKWLQRYSFRVKPTPGVPQDAIGIVRVHVYSKIDFKLNQEFRFTGFMYENDDEDTWEHLNLPCMHVTAIDKEVDSCPDRNILDLSNLNFIDVRSSILNKLSKVIANDVVAEFMMLFAMRQGISNVSQITPIHFSFTNAPNVYTESGELYFTGLLKSFLLQVCDKTACIDLSEFKLNNKNLFPCELEETIVPNELFFAKNTHLILNEEDELKSALTQTAMTNASSFQELMNNGRNVFHCAHGLVYADCPLLIASVSKNRSFLRKLVEFVEIPLAETNMQLREAYQNGTDFNGSFTDSEVRYFYKARECASWLGVLSKLEMTEDSQLVIQKWYTSVRKNGIYGSDHVFEVQDLHFLLLIARLICRSYHVNLMTSDIANKAILLNENRLRLKIQ